MRLRVDRFSHIWGVLGKSNLTEIAAEMGMSTKQIRRARQGDPVGGTFMASTVSTLSRYAEQLAAQGLEPTLDYLFEAIDSHRTVA